MPHRRTAARLCSPWRTGIRCSHTRRWAGEGEAGRAVQQQLVHAAPILRRLGAALDATRSLSQERVGIFYTLPSPPCPSWRRLGCTKSEPSRVGPGTGFYLAMAQGTRALCIVVDGHPPIRLETPDGFGAEPCKRSNWTGRRAQYCMKSRAMTSGCVSAVVWFADVKEVVGCIGIHSYLLSSIRVLG